jgi:hypothetical protein
MPTVIDDRTDAQRQTHSVLIVGDDGFMTRLGPRCGTVGKAGKSRAAWACTPEHADTVERWVRGRNDLKRVRRAVRVYPKRGDHIHVYVVTDDHPALGGD